ncbi:Galactosylgalactosylxylosylprotein 3-beta-glucuronosyltransferase S [Orchesella cincta]|uniref:Galactosylgalactosylxylosylprotein 3-beta-glucuronosyltransferase n=1 Tax=Orchesella cincta TaxID=48709 RepID=A0A1D2MFP9_ORCCI|nr:Galactosylgalactosylxylosylprotein 3-beta-glucuronosyltransferase S [Orchesella cincta]
MVSSVVWEVVIVLIFMCGLFFLFFHQIIPFQLLLPSRARTRRQVDQNKKFILVCAGIFVALLYRFWFYHEDPDNRFNSAWHLLPNGSLIMNKQNYSRLLGQTSNKKPVIFITTTDYSIIQQALLTRLAQALFPVRDMIRWIVVSLPLDTGAQSYQIMDSKTETTFASSVQKNDNFVQVHLENLDKILARFGVPYVLLSSHKMVRVTWGGFFWHSSSSRDIRGYQTGLLWVLKNLPNGVILFGDEHFTYHSALFKELQDTKIAACWPVGFGPNDAAMTIPLMSKDTKTENLLLVGYDDGRAIWSGGVKFETGAFAVDLEYFRNKVPFTEYWKLAYNRIYNNNDFNIPLEDVQVMGKHDIRMAYQNAWCEMAKVAAWKSKHMGNEYRKVTEEYIWSKVLYPSHMKIEFIGAKSRTSN